MEVEHSRVQRIHVRVHGKEVTVGIPAWLWRKTEGGGGVGVVVVRRR